MSSSDDLGTLTRDRSGPAIEMTGPENGSLRSAFESLPPRVKTLVSRWIRGLFREQRRPLAPSVEDSRGQVVRRIETVQTLLTSAEIDRLVGDYRAGATVGDLAKQYGIHRATVSAHLSRSIPRRAAGLDVDDQAEAVRLFREGISMRAIARRLGAGRQTVRVCLVDAGVITDASGNCQR